MSHVVSWGETWDDFTGKKIVWLFKHSCIRQVLTRCLKFMTSYPHLFYVVSWSGLEINWSSAWHKFQNEVILKNFFNRVWRPNRLEVSRIMLINLVPRFSLSLCYQLFNILCVMLISVQIFSVMSLGVLFFDCDIMWFRVSVIWTHSACEGSCHVI